ncbi:DUF1573 domain-containing protein [Limibacter armeniacum]|uniref:DUF1573 domain-containing protein n=1 Tax=Limibacter armeniacum TaxID=466084 RepID=UPI002FE612BA
MKKLFFTLLLPLFCIVAAQAQQAENTATSELKFSEKTFDFGDISQGDVVTHVFKFENSGAAPLVLSNVSTTCGCTAPAWPREPIAPGETAEITIKFNSRGKMGKQNKVITINSNASNAVERISITANVLKAESSN